MCSLMNRPQQVPDYQTAFAHYEAKMRPFVETNQALASLGQQEGFGDEEGHAKILQAVDEAKNAIALEGLN